MFINYLFIINAIITIIFNNNKYIINKIAYIYMIYKTNYIYCHYRGYRIFFRFTPRREAYLLQTLLVIGVLLFIALQSQKLLINKINCHVLLYIKRGLINNKSINNLFFISTSRLKIITIFILFCNFKFSINIVHFNLSISFFIKSIHNTFLFV